MKTSTLALAVLALVACGDSTVRFAPADLSVSTTIPPFGCLSDRVCTDSAKDCAMGERCNHGVQPPRCQKLLCGPNGTACDGPEKNDLCVSGQCGSFGAPGVCASTVVDMSAPPDFSGVVCQVPTFDNFQGNYPAFDIKANASSVIPAGQRAYAITSNGSGTYRLTWTDGTGAPTCFTGLVTGNSAFSASQITTISGPETVELKQANQIAFASVPGASVHGFDFFSTQDPVYLDVFADNAAVSIYFSNAQTGSVESSGDNPSAFSSQ